MVQGQTPEEPLIDFLFISGPKTTTWSIKTLPENPMGECAAICSPKIKHTWAMQQDFPQDITSVLKSNGGFEGFGVV